MGPKTIGGLTECTAPALGDQVEIETVAGAPRRLSFTRLYALLFGGKVIGGSGAGDILTNNGGQTATGMRLDSPKINSAAALSATGEQIDDAVTIAQTYLQNVDADVQVQLDAKVDASVLGNYPRRIRLNFTTGGAETTKQYTEANILTALGLSSYYIDYAATWAVLKKSGSDWTVDSSAVMTITEQANPVTGQVHLSSFNLSGLTAATNYTLVLVAGVLAIASSGA